MNRVLALLLSTMAIALMATGCITTDRDVENSAKNDPLWKTEEHIIAQIRRARELRQKCRDYEKVIIPTGYLDQRELDAQECEEEVYHQHLKRTLAEVSSHIEELRSWRETLMNKFQSDSFK